MTQYMRIVHMENPMQKLFYQDTQTAPHSLYVEAVCDIHIFAPTDPTNSIVYLLWAMQKHPKKVHVNGVFSCVCVSIYIINILFFH